MSYKVDLDLGLVREKIKDSGFKMRHIATEIGVKPNTLSSYVSGKRGLGTSAKLLLCDILGIDRKSITEKAS